MPSNEPSFRAEEELGDRALFGKEDNPEWKLATNLDDAVLYFLHIVNEVCLLISWFIALFTGEWNPSLKNFCIGVFRWQLRGGVVPAAAERRVSAVQPGALAANESGGAPAPLILVLVPAQGRVTRPCVGSARATAVWRPEASSLPGDPR